MTVRRSVFPLLAVFLAAAGLRAQSTVPTASQSLPAQAMAAGGANLSVDLRNYFSLPGVTGQVVQFDTVMGKFNVELLANDAPATVTNFLAYVADGSYNGTIYHRSLPLGETGNRISQGGGYLPNGSSITRKAPIPLEYKLANARGTLAMARSSDLNSATSEWFFNVDDNTSVLGQNNGGGYAVFGRVIGSGMTVVDAIGSLPNYNAGGAFSNIPLRDMQPGQNTIQTQNLIIVSSIAALPVYATGTGASVLSFAATNSASGVVNATINGSTLDLSAVADGAAVVTVRATDINGNAADASFAVNVSPGPVFVTQPESRTVTAGQSVELFSSAAGASSYQWQRNGVDISGAVGQSYAIGSVQPGDVGVYLVRATNASGTRTSEPAIVALSSAVKVVGAGIEVGQNIVHSNGNIYDQVLLTGAAATITADQGQIVRISYIDPTDDIVQVEFGGAGALTLSLENPSGPATPVKYNQTVNYMKGRATIVIAGADATTNVSVFSVGRATAVNQALFRNDVTYDGMADIALVAIHSPGSAFGGVRTANTKYSAAAGLTGVYAPRVAIGGGPFYVGNISASGSATPSLIAGSASDVRITGGDLQQVNNAAVRVDGMTKVQMAAGSDSHGNLQPAQPLRGRLERSGVDVSAQLAN